MSDHGHDFSSKGNNYGQNAIFSFINLAKVLGYCRIKFRFSLIKWLLLVFTSLEATKQNSFYKITKLKKSKNSQEYVLINGQNPSNPPIVDKLNN